MRLVITLEQYKDVYVILFWEKRLEQELSVKFVLPSINLLTNKLQLKLLKKQKYKIRLIEFGLIDK
jgi:hypothetical protein